MAQPLPERVIDVNEATQNTVNVDNVNMAPHGDGLPHHSRKSRWGF